MSSTTDLIATLHRMLGQLADLRDRYDRGPRQVKAREALVAKAEAELAAAKLEVKQARAASDQKNLLLKTGEGKINDLRVKLNQAQSNREYQALVEQIAASEMANSVMADEILEGLERIDVLQRAVPVAEAALAKAREELAKNQAVVRDQEQLILGDIARIEAERQGLEATLPEDFVAPYHRSVKGKGAEALAAVENDSCAGCHQKVTTNQLIGIQQGKLVACGPCGRILYLPEGSPHRPSRRNG
jgi:hypothetical protein